MPGLTRLMRLGCVIVLLCVGYAVPASALTTEEVVAKSKDSIVRILIEVRPGDKGLLQHYNFKGDRRFKEPIRIKAGTGFVIREDGYILTAYHVVSPLGMSPNIYVRLPKEGDQLAEIVAKDPERQIACIKIKRFNLKPLALSEVMPKVGGDVFTMGYPFAADTSEITDQEPTFTEGKVGALKQSRQESSFIQTNAAINLGNSGGPLLGREGQVVGVIIGSADRTLKKLFEGLFAEKDIPVGIGFATPCKPTLDMLKAAGIEVAAAKATPGPVAGPSAVEPDKAKAAGEKHGVLPVVIAGCLALLLLAALVLKKLGKSAPEEKAAPAPIQPQPDFPKNTTISLGTLICTEGELAGKTFPMTGNGLTIGRDNECDIMLSAEVISRRHSWIGPKGGDIAVRDMGSTNGTFVNGQKVEGTLILKSGDSVSLSKSGQEIFQFAD